MYMYYYYYICSIIIVIITIYVQYADGKSESVS